MSGPLEMPHEEPSRHMVMNPSRDIKKPVLDVSSAALAEVLVNNQHQSSDM